MGSFYSWNRNEWLRRMCSSPWPATTTSGCDAQLCSSTWLVRRVQRASRYSAHVSSFSCIHTHLQSHTLQERELPASRPLRATRSRSCLRGHRACSALCSAFRLALLVQRTGQSSSSSSRHPQSHPPLRGGGGGGSQSGSRLVDSQRRQSRPCANAAHRGGESSNGSSSKGGKSRCRSGHLTPVVDRTHAGGGVRCVLHGAMQRGVCEPGFGRARSRSC